jgi:ribonuclease D
MSGLHLVRDRVQLAVARELWKAREKLAIEKDVSPGRLLPDASMVHACKQNYHSIEALTSDSNFIGRASRVYKQVWWQAIESGRSTQDPPTLATRQEGIPNHRSWPAKFPDADRRLKILRHFMTGHAEALQLPLENLLHPEIIRRIAWELSDPNEELLASLLNDTAARAWQTESCLEVIANALRAAADPDFALPDPQATS